MLKSLLVPLDGSGLSEQSLPLAGEVSQATGASVHLVHVHVPYEPDQLLSNTSFQWEGVDLDEYDARHKEDENAYLDGVETRFKARGLSVRSKLLDGWPIAHQLESYAVEVDTDLIVMTSYGRSGVRRAWFGSVADEMIRRSKLPVVLVHRRRETGLTGDGLSVRHVLVPLDGSELAEAVLGPATDLARATGSRVTLTHVLPPQGAFGLGHPPEVERMEAYLDETAEAVARDGLDVRTHLTRGRVPAREIAGAASTLGADLIAMATHGLGGVRRALIGSVADRVVSESELPLLILRPPAVG